MKLMRRKSRSGCLNEQGAGARVHLVDNRVLVLLLLAFVCLSTAGCAHMGRLASGIKSKLTGRRPAEFVVIPFSNQDVVELTADDVVQLMRRAGFSDEQILELGTDLRNGLFHSGAAQVKRRDTLEAVFAVHGDYVFITTRLRGTFIYDVKRGWVQLSTRAQGS